MAVVDPLGVCAHVDDLFDLDQHHLPVLVFRIHQEDVQAVYGVTVRLVEEYCYHASLAAVEVAKGGLV